MVFEPYTFSLIFFFLYGGGDVVVNYYLSLKLYKHASEWKMGEDPGACPSCWLLLILFFLERAASLPYLCIAAAERLRGLHMGFLYWLKLCLWGCCCLWRLRVLKPGFHDVPQPSNLLVSGAGRKGLRMCTSWENHSLPVSSLVPQKLLFLLQAEPFSGMSQNTILSPLPTEMI